MIMSTSFVPVSGSVRVGRSSAGRPSRYAEALGSEANVHFIDDTIHHEARSARFTAGRT